MEVTLVSLAGDEHVILINNDDNITDKIKQYASEQFVLPIEMFDIHEGEELKFFIKPSKLCIFEREYNFIGKDNDLSQIWENRRNKKHLNSLLYSGDRVVIKLSLLLGADINCTENLYKFSPLMSALNDDHLLSLIELFVYNGADVNAVVSDTITPLSIAVNNCSLNVVKLLIHNKANNNYLDKYNENVLFSACRNNAPFEIIKYLIDIGTNINIKNKNNFSALGVSLYHDDSRVFNYYLNHVTNINFSAKNIILEALYLGCEFSVIKDIIDAGSRLSCTEWDKYVKYNKKYENNEITKYIAKYGLYGKKSRNISKKYSCLCVIT